LLNAGKVYVPPKKLRKRNEVPIEPREIMPDQKTTGMEMHKDYMFANAWENFKVPYGQCFVINFIQCINGY